MKRILVTGAGGPAGANFIKSLRLSDEEFYISGSDINSLHLELSNSDSKNLLPQCDSSDYVDSVNEVVRKEGIDLVHPQPDSEVSVLSERRDEVEAKLFLPDKQTIRICQDKMLFMKTLGLDWGNFMLSEFLPGREYAFQSVWKEGEIVSSQARQRLEYLFGYLTPSGQTSSPTVAKTVHNEDVNRIATDAVKAVDGNATGVFCVDLKENTEGVPCVTEINAGRFFTTSNFFSEAGVNMPYMYIKLAFEESFEYGPKYNPLPEGLYWIRLMDMGHKLVR
jgi:glutathione synthase/RimK-type ligase-like ATP-grasp enzyme